MYRERAKFREKKKTMTIAYKLLNRQYFSDAH